MKSFLKVSLGDLGVFLSSVHFSAHLCSYPSMLSYFCCGTSSVHISGTMHYLS